MLLASTPPYRIAQVRLVFAPALMRVGVWLNEPPPFTVKMLFSSLTGRLYAPNAFADHDTSRFTGRVSCVPRASEMPSTTVSEGAVNVEFEIGCETRIRFANRNRLLDLNGSASEKRSEKLLL